MTSWQQIFLPSQSERYHPISDRELTHEIMAHFYNQPELRRKSGTHPVYSVRHQEDSGLGKQQCKKIFQIHNFLTFIFVE